MFKKNKILAITLARGNSKGIKKKNIISLMNKPLIYYTIIEAKKSKYIDDYIISTDDLEIKKIAERYAANVPFLRPKKYSKDNSSSVIALQHAVKYMENKNQITYDFIIELMATNPLKNVKDIDECIKKRIKKIVNDKIKNFCINEIKESRRQDLMPKAYIRSGSIYALKRDYLMNESERYGSNNSRPYVLPMKRAVNIDEASDLILAEHMLKSKK